MRGFSCQKSGSDARLPIVVFQHQRGGALMAVLGVVGLIFIAYWAATYWLPLWHAKREIDRENLAKKILVTMENEARDIAEWVISTYDPTLSHPEWRRCFRELEDRITAAIQRARNEEREA
ncbi:MAG: hypothetical protein RIQ56_746, partial [Candidatus Parcubacteria bacterium]